MQRRLGARMPSCVCPVKSGLSLEGACAPKRPAGQQTGVKASFAAFASIRRPYPPCRAAIERADEWERQELVLSEGHRSGYSGRFASAFGRSTRSGSARSKRRRSVRRRDRRSALAHRHRRHARGAAANAGRDDHERRAAEHSRQSGRQHRRGNLGHQRLHDRRRDRHPDDPVAADDLGRKRYFLVCIAGFTAASFACGISTSIDELIAFRDHAGNVRRGLVGDVADDFTRHVSARTARRQSGHFRAGRDHGSGARSAA